mmetsp:Transcript_21048/g.35303  ORF Transcript_21048/g.35303 Transcript_21048/m.35303 type:complete len:398 (+) Transcript_21048:1148-2341(+)
MAPLALVVVRDGALVPHILHHPEDLDPLSDQILLVGQVVGGFVVRNFVGRQVLPEGHPSRAVELLEPLLCLVLLVVRLGGRVSLVLLDVLLVTHTRGLDTGAALDVVAIQDEGGDHVEAHVLPAQHPTAPPHPLQLARSVAVDCLVDLDPAHLLPRSEATIEGLEVRGRGPLLPEKHLQRFSLQRRLVTPQPVDAEFFYLQPCITARQHVVRLHEPQSRDAHDRDEASGELLHYHHGVLSVQLASPAQLAPAVDVVGGEEATTLRLQPHRYGIQCLHTAHYVHLSNRLGDMRALETTQIATCVLLTEYGIRSVCSKGLTSEVFNISPLPAFVAAKDALDIRRTGNADAQPPESIKMHAFLVSPHVGLNDLRRRVQMLHPSSFLFQLSFLLKCQLLPS